MNMFMRLFALPALAATLAIVPSSALAVDDGTYMTVSVLSTEECAQICSDDTQCRGWTLMQPDTRYPESQCSLNNGLGSQTPFPQIAPDPIDLMVALQDLNNYRVSKGLSTLTISPQLTAAAQAHSDDLALTGNAAHEGSDGSLHDIRLRRQGYEFKIAAENVATGQKSWEAAFEAWQKSPGHNRNLLLDNVTELGVALAHEPTTTYVNYWTMVLAAPL